MRTPAESVEWKGILRNGDMPVDRRTPRPWAPEKTVRAQPDRLSQRNSDLLVLHGRQLALDVLHKNGCNSPDVPMAREDGAEPGFVRAILIEQADKTPGLDIRLDMQFGQHRNA